MDKQTKHAVIFASRPVSAGMRRYVAEGAVVIAADAGWKNARALGLAVDIAVGDFDSSEPPEGAGEVVRLPAEKDDTDTHCAARIALERGFDDVTILGAMGGRPDHAHGNMQTLLFLAQNGVKARMADESSVIRCFGPGRHTLPAGEGPWLSVFTADGTARGVFLGGVKYPLDGAVLPPSLPIGVSNEFAAAEAVVGCDEGWLYVYVCKDS